MITVRLATPNDWDAIWTIFEPIVRAGETYGYARTTTYDEAHTLWMEIPQRTFVALLDGAIVGTYYLKPNQHGGGSHVSNAGFMVSPAARGRGTAKAMCRHAFNQAQTLGYRAMQFNFVISTNTAAIALWEKCGFKIVGRLPKAFDHPTRGYVDALVMYKKLTGETP